MEENKIKRTVKKLFITADNVSRRVKCFGVYAGPFIASMALKTVLDSKSENGDNDENEYSEDNNE